MRNRRGFSVKSDTRRVADMMISLSGLPRLCRSGTIRERRPEQEQSTPILALSFIPAANWTHTKPGLPEPPIFEISAPAPDKFRLRLLPLPLVIVVVVVVVVVVVALVVVVVIVIVILRVSKK